MKSKVMRKSNAFFVWIRKYSKKARIIIDVAGSEMFKENLIINDEAGTEMFKENPIINDEAGTEVFE